MANFVLGFPLADLVHAKRALVGRWSERLRREAPRARALRARRLFRSEVPLNLVGVGVGEKVSGGVPTGRGCIKVLVARKYPLGRISPPHRIPAHIDGLPTDVEEVGYARALPARAGARRPLQASGADARRRHRPVPGGVSVGLGHEAAPFRYAGTLGVVLADRQRPSARLGLSNNHVLADENRAPLGSAVIQPGSLDGGRDADRAGALDRSETLRFENQPNRMDAAAFAFDAAVASSAEILGIGVPAGVADPELSSVVRKTGRTTGFTEGIVRALRFDVTSVGYDQGLVRVDDVIVIEGVKGDFSAAGDSGSAILDSRGRLVALLFAGSPSVTFAIPIDRILERFDMALPRAAGQRRRPGRRPSRTRRGRRNPGARRRRGR
jgi:hypothetical protein